MSSLIVLKFPKPDGAENALATLRELQKQALIQLADAAIVTWPQGAKAPKTKQALPLAGLGALDGAFWGLLFGLLFFVPIIGLAVGAALGALSGKFSDYGINDEFIKDVRSKVTEGTSALFILASNIVVDRVADAFQGQEMELLSSNLSREQGTELLAAFSGSVSAAA